jgi:hypothetical protein
MAARRETATQPAISLGRGAPPPYIVRVRRWYVLAAAVTALVLWHAWFSHFNHDEIEHLHAAWLIAQGQRPFSDFLEQHHPTLWYLFAPVVGAFGSVRALVFAGRLFDLACLLAVLATFVRMFRRLYPGALVRWPLLLLATSFMFVRNTLEVRPDPLMNALLYGALLCWVSFLQDLRRARALLAGLLFGLAIAVLQKALVILALVGAASLLLALRHRSDRARSLRLVEGAALLGIGAAVPVALLFAFMAERGIWQDFWFWNYRFNRFFYLQAVLPKHFSVLVTLGLSVAEAPALWFVGVAGAAMCARERWRARAARDGRDDGLLGLLLVGAGYVPFLVLNRFPLEQYFIVLLPLLALFSAEVFERVRAPRPRAWLERAALLDAVVLAAILLAYPPNRKEREVQDLVLAQTAPGEPVFMPPPYNPMFRRDAAYFWYNGALIGDAYAEYCRTRGECPGNKHHLDEQRWASDPPRFVYLEEPSYQPIHWAERSRAYQATGVPRLYRVAR